MNIPLDIEVDEMMALTLMGYERVTENTLTLADPAHTYVMRDAGVLARSVVTPDHAWYNWEPFSPCTNLNHTLEVKRKALALGLSIMVRSTKGLGVMAVVTLGSRSVGTYVCDLPEREPRAVCMALLRALDELGRMGVKD